MKSLSFVLFALTIVACNSGGKVAAPSIDEAVTQQVLDHHFQTFQQNDLDGVMADYVEESVLITPDRTYKGLAEIRENFVSAYKALPTNGTTITTLKSIVNKDVAYIVWKATTPTLEFKFATDTFIIQNGKIVRQTYAGDVAAITAAK